MADPVGGGSTGAVVGLAAAMTFMPFGVSTLTMALGAGGFFIGCCARIGLTMYKKLEGPGDVTLKDFYRSMAMLVCCIPLAAVASCVLYLAAHVAKLEVDGALCGVLLIAGVRGPEGFTWIMDTLANAFTKFIPGSKPAGGGT